MLSGVTADNWCVSGTSLTVCISQSVLPAQWSRAVLTLAAGSHSTVPRCVVSRAGIAGSGTGCVRSMVDMSATTGQSVLLYHPVSPLLSCVVCRT